MTPHGYTAALALAALLGAWPLLAGAQIQVYGLAARVNGEPIAAERLERNFDEYLREKQINISALRSPQRVKTLKREVLDLLIDQELLWQEAQRRSMLATPAEVQAAIATVRGGYSSPSAFVGRIQAEGYSQASYAEHMRRLMSARKVLEQMQGAAAGAIDDAAVHDFYTRNEVQFTQAEQLRLRHLYLPFAADTNEAQKAAARARMAGLRAQAGAGADFAALAREHSRGSSAAQGGDLGFVQRDELAAPLAEAAFALAEGGVSAVVELPDGLHLLKAEQRIAAERLAEDGQRERIRAHLQQEQAQQARSALLERLRTEARIEVLLPLPPADAKTEEALSPTQRARALGR